MAVATVFNVEVRKEKGSNKVKRLRANGKVPAVIYGHGEEPVCLSVPADVAMSALRDGERVVSLKGGASGDAFIKEVHWDTFGATIMHIDFSRVSAGEIVETTVVIELRGDAPGTHVGGVVHQHVHELDIKMPVSEITDKIEVNINSLELDQSIKLGDLEFPPGSEPQMDADTIVVECIERVEVEEEDLDAAASPAEPEIIGRKEDEEGESDS